MTATVHDVWAAALPPGTQLAGGEAGLGQEVRWIVTLRPRPPGLVGLKGGELVLVAPETLRTLDDRLTLARVVEQLAQAGVVALAVRGQVDTTAVARADALGLPLFAVPAEASLGESEQRALRLLAERQAETHEYNRRIQQQLTELLIAGHELPAIVDRLAHLTRRAVAVEDASGLRHLRRVMWIDERRPRLADEECRASHRQGDRRSDDAGCRAVRAGVRAGG